MKYRMFGLLAGAAMALAACGQKDNTADTGVQPETGTTDMTNVLEPAPLPSAGQSFANAAAASDAFEIATSRLALEKSKSSAIKAFANRMIDAHSQSTQKLTTAAAGLSPSITPDSALTPDQQQALDGLKSKDGSDFDSAYAAAQVDGHQKALDALKSYAATGDVPAFKDLATGLIPTVTAHLNMAKGLKP